MRIAVLADVHGNLLALQAVLADLRTASPDLVVNLGDLATGPFDPAGSADDGEVPHAIETGSPHIRCAVIIRGTRDT